MSSQAIILIGFMGAGKTSVGRELAQRTDRLFIDLDQVIEEEEKCSISTIFSSKGESYFRKLETASLKKHLSQKCIIATGGGIVESNDAVQLLKKQEQVIYLKTDIETLRQRIKADSFNKRPLAENLESEVFLSRFNERQPIYEALASRTIDVTKLTISEITTRLLEKERT